MRLLKEVKTFRFENEVEADNFVQQEKDNQNGYEITKTVVQLKNKKSKGVIVDTWAQCEITYNYDIEE